MEPWNCWALGSPITILGGLELSGKTKALRNDHHNSSHAGQKKFTKTWGRVMKKKTFLRPLKVEASPFLRPLKVETTPLKNLPSPSSLLLLM